MSGLTFTVYYKDDKKQDTLKTKKLWVSKKCITLIQPFPENESETAIFTSLDKSAFISPESFNAITKRLEDD